ncbi:MAG: Pycsar system effector family protein [Calditrichia bacterium]
MADDKFRVLFHILTSEQQILQRSDQKAFTLLSVLGVFMVFFIVHYTRIPKSFLVIFFVFLFFISALITILSMLLVISPRIKNVQISASEKKLINPTFFGGIVQFKNSGEYAEHLNLFLDKPDAIYEAFADSIYSIGYINAYKSKYLRRGIIAFISAITLELIIIVAMYVNLFSQLFLPQ